jgi:hypothetical protein
VLRAYDHVVYNSRDTRAGTAAAGGSAAPAVSSDVPPRALAAPSTDLVLSVVGDGDAELFGAYPLDSVMPFWLLQETLFNAVDWLYNCGEPEPNANNAHTVCGNRFDGGAGAFQARVRIDRFETWTAGGPASSTSAGMLVESARFTHQATPLCCGAPHTAGESSHVHFFSGKVFTGEAGHASVAGLNVYGMGCEQPFATFCCHHAVSQVVPGGGTPGTLFQLQNLVAHEIGHNAGGAEDHLGLSQDWLFGTQSGPTLMHSGFDGFPSEEIFVYAKDAAEEQIAPILARRLGGGPDVAAMCGSVPVY